VLVSLLRFVLWSGIAAHGGFAEMVRPLAAEGVADDRPLGPAHGHVAPLDRPQGRTNEMDGVGPRTVAPGHDIGRRKKKQGGADKKLDGGEYELDGVNKNVGGGYGYMDRLAEDVRVAFNGEDASV